MSASEAAFHIRPAREDDVPAITRMYAFHVVYGTASWEYEPPGDEEMLKRMRAVVAQGYPYFVAEAGGAVAGYSYASTYRARPGYRFTIEDSVYVDGSYQRRGIARALLSALIDRCGELGFQQMLAVIGDSANTASIELHRSMGFRHVGTFTRIGFKHGRWLDSVQMQRTLRT